MEELAGIYKFARLGVLAMSLVGITLYLYSPSRKQRLEQPALRMLEDDDR